MILEALTRHYETLVSLGVVPLQGWCFTNVTHALKIDKYGKLLSVISVSAEEDRGKKKIKIPASMEVPERVVRSGNILPNFLCDNSSYLLGIDENGAAEAAVKRFEASKNLHHKLLAEVHSEASEAIKKFFILWDPLKAEEELIKDIQGITGNFVFMLDDTYIQNDDEIRKAWEGHLEMSDTGPSGICLVTGKRDKLVRLHPKIKGVKGGQAGGSALISYNEKAYESFGKEQSYNAPIGRYAAFAYSTALNYILSQQDYKFCFGDSTITYWMESGKKEDQDLFLRVLTEPMDSWNMEQINKLDCKVFVLGLAPNAARLAIRFFYQNSFKKILANIEAHRIRMQHVDCENKDESLLRGLLKAEESGSAVNMLFAIISDSNYPESLYRNTITQIRFAQSGEKVTNERVAIINAYLLKNKKWEFCSDKEGSVTNEKMIEKETPWILGKTFAVLEKLQEEAITEINTPITNRYFNAACATPEKVFPALMKLKNSHLKKLEAENKEYYEAMLAPLTRAVQVYPKRLGLEGQGMFISGYHHQKNILENRGN